MPPELVSERSRKRARAARACEHCRMKKYRCDELTPCSKCRRWNVACVYQDVRHLRNRLEIQREKDLADTIPAQSTHESIVQEHGRTTDSTLRFTSRENCSDNSARESRAHRLNAHTIEDQSEINEVNAHTLNTEFHGPTSSLAFLAAVHKHNKAQPSRPVRLNALEEDGTQSLVSAFHNDAFMSESTTRVTTESRTLAADRFHFRQSQLFLDGYFQNLHFIHPIINKEAFLRECEALWFGGFGKESRSFIALYYAVMSLGALIREWDEDLLDDMNRFEWSRKLFRLATLALGDFPGMNDLETVQANIILAKVCQNELNPHLAYMFLGHATRTSLSAGYNRCTSSGNSRALELDDMAISRTWWGLYSLEMELSFALGRPDSLGLDVYHTRAMPAMDDLETAILPCMVNLAHIIRKVSTSVYLAGSTIAGKLVTAGQLELELDNWINGLPRMIRPPVREDSTDVARAMTKIPKWASRQSHTLRFRYYNIKMVLYRPFLLYVAQKRGSSPQNFDMAVSKCVGAARDTIKLMFDMFCHYSYFRTWWYNTTYTLYAASIIQFYATKIAPRSERSSLDHLLRLSIDILQAMDENGVAKKAAALLNKASTQISGDLVNGEADFAHEVTHQQQSPFIALSNASEALSSDGFIYDPFNEDQLDFMSQLFPLSDTNEAFWVE